MEINLIHVPLIELVQGFHEDPSTDRVVAWNGKLEVRPAYQRAFVYEGKEQEAVINSVIHKYPLNSVYFVKLDDGTYEVLDGQQRIISICRYEQNLFSVPIFSPALGVQDINRPNLKDPYKANYESYELPVYVCEGTEEEKIEWFKTINIVGKDLTLQEIRNAIYHGTWTTDAKALFSRRGCPANKNYGKYLKGEYIRQRFLETAIAWKADAEGYNESDNVAGYMRDHRNDQNANDLWKYFEDVFKWVKTVFGEYDKHMQGLKWGLWYNQYKNNIFDPAEVQATIATLMADREVQRKEGIYEYILTGKEKCLNLRIFDDDIKTTVYAQQSGRCYMCGKAFDITEMHADHWQPWSKGGKTTIDNCKLLCRDCNLKKGAQ